MGGGRIMKGLTTLDKYWDALGQKAKIQALGYTGIDPIYHNGILESEILHNYPRNTQNSIMRGIKKMLSVPQ